MRKKDFIAAYSRYIEQGSGGLFIGAGLSMGAGYPGWSELVKDMAEEIGLDVTQETDLPGVVQFFLNQAGKTRTRLARTISEHFGPDKPIPDVFRILARLPLRYLWTTNYDTLTERAWREQRKRLDVKSENKDIILEDPWAHAVLYKMHGTVEHPADVVIAKGDYESYRSKRVGFIHLLTGHLVSRHILFLGFSFTDPNLSHLFTLMRESFEDTPPEHFAIVTKPRREAYTTDSTFDYAKRRHRHWVDDLQNYGIQCVEVERYEEIDELLRAVERRLAMSSVMISGSFPDTRDADHLGKRSIIEAVAHDLGQVLMSRQYRLVSGFGLVVGSAALAGALDELNQQETPNFEKSVFLRPFPQIIPKGEDRQEYYNRYRKDLVTQAGVCIFIAGIKDDKGNFVTADGVLREFEIAIEADRIPIPIAATGGAALEIWNRVNADYHKSFGNMPRDLFDSLRPADPSPEGLVKTVEAILVWIQKNDPKAEN